MTVKRKGPALLLLLLAGGIVCHVAGGPARSYGVPLALTASLALSLALLRRPRRVVTTPDPHDTPHDTTLPRAAGKEKDGGRSGLQAEVLGARYRRQRRREMEEVVDRVLDEYLALIRARLDCHTAAVFFPTADGGYKIRRFVSECDYINSDAVIYPGMGVIGSFLKDGLKQLNLQEIVSDSMTLYYYSKDAGIRSLMASPIVAHGVERGTVIVDSTQKKNFSDEDHVYLSHIASVLGQTVYYAYLYNEHRLEYQSLVSMSTIEKDFFVNLDMEAILDRMVEIIPFAIACDRLTISVRDGDANQAVIRRVWGEHTQGLLDKSFSLEEKSLVGLLYTKNICFYRDFSEHHYERRYFDGEPANREFGSFMAFPFGVDQCKGALLLESYRLQAFTPTHRTLLTRLATSVGLAVEKIQILETANALATRDGLTGLYNHRQFQSMLKDEVTRASRYADSVALVLCDIDFFKKVNDTYGHPFGDTVLKGVAAQLQENVREVDTAARYGGEEFALILARSNTAHALETAQRIRAIIAERTFRHMNEKVPVTMSFGVAVYGEHANSIDSLIKKADKALYRAKKGGRNRVEVF